MTPRLAAGLSALLSAIWVAAAACADNGPPPNVVLIMTDDQGYGDVGAHGNAVLKTPRLDELYRQSVRLVDFHVDPTCSPTRAALMTGRYSGRVGVWHTVMGRSMLRADETTMADLLAAAGYRTGIFGKWHLGDNYPLRAQDRGFHAALVHGGGGVGQTPDWWGNDYFDDTYLRNGRPEPQQGYCTDVWFTEALRFIEQNRERPFFCYIPTNAPHGPFLVDEKYAEPYRRPEVPYPAFYGMIANIDENLGKLLTRLKELKLEENTILIFMTDNGTAGGWHQGKGFNAGMRGIKGSQYEGGHRVPCYIRWPAGGLGGGRDVAQLAAHIDLLPTLAELCGLTLPEDVKLDGASLAPLLRGEAKDWPDRTLFVESQRIEKPEKWRQSAVMTARWRLVDGKELYDIQADPGQQHDLAEQHPHVVSQLRQRYDAWWADISRRHDEYTRIAIGAEQENPARLTAHDWHAPLPQVPWNQSHVRNARFTGNGFWAVEVARAGRYRFILRRHNEPAANGAESPAPAAALPADQARVKLGEAETTAEVPKGAASVTLELELPAGPAMLQTWLTDSKTGRSDGAFFVEVRYLEMP